MLSFCSAAEARAAEQAATASEAEITRYQNKNTSLLSQVQVKVLPVSSVLMGYRHGDGL